MQQRLCIARALAMKPDVLLMDEPTSALDPIATKHIEELLLELQKEVTILIVTHNMGQAMRISSKSMFMYLGELVEYDDTQKMFSDQTVYSKFEGSVAAPTAGLHFTTDMIEDMRSRGFGFDEVTLHVGAGTFLPVKSENAAQHPMHTEHFEVRLKTLERNTSVVSVP